MTVRGVEQDYSKAMEWYLKASDAGNEYAMLRIGVMYKNGRGVDQDDGKAVSHDIRYLQFRLALGLIRFVFVIILIRTYLHSLV